MIIRTPAQQVEWHFRRRCQAAFRKIFGRIGFTTDIPFFLKEDIGTMFAWERGVIRCLGFEFFSTGREHSLDKKFIVIDRQGNWVEHDCRPKTESCSCNREGTRSEIESYVTALDLIHFHAGPSLSWERLFSFLSLLDQGVGIAPHQYWLPEPLNYLLFDVFGTLGKQRKAA